MGVEYEKRDKYMMTMHWHISETSFLLLSILAQRSLDPQVKMEFGPKLLVVVCMYVIGS